ncbi:hypothetical protein CHUAL_001514 [Chamberlinius hualienensis]
MFTRDMPIISNGGAQKVPDRDTFIVSDKMFTRDMPIISNGGAQKVPNRDTLIVSNKTSGDMLKVSRIEHTDQSKISSSKRDIKAQTLRNSDLKNKKFKQKDSLFEVQDGDVEGLVEMLELNPNSSPTSQWLDATIELCRADDARLLLDATNDRQIAHIPDMTLTAVNSNNMSADTTQRKSQKEISNKESNPWSEKMKITNKHVSEFQNFILKIVKNCSNFNRTILKLGWIFRAVKLFKLTKVEREKLNIQKYLTFDELNFAEAEIAKQIQVTEFSKEINSLKRN